MGISLSRLPEYFTALSFFSPFFLRQAGFLQIVCVVYMIGGILSLAQVDSSSFYFFSPFLLNFDLLFV